MPNNSGPAGDDKLQTSDEYDLPGELKRKAERWATHKQSSSGTSTVLVVTYLGADQEVLHNGLEQQSVPNRKFIGFLPCVSLNTTQDIQST